MYIIKCIKIKNILNPFFQIYISIYYNVFYHVALYFDQTIAPGQKYGWLLLLFIAAKTEIIFC